jgi:glycosyltransferase involved in cell wall biosynthesis
MGSRSKSIAYAMRNFIARKTDVFRQYVDIFIVQSEFQKRKFIELGIPEEKIAILPGIAPDPTSDEQDIKPDKLVSFIGRVSREKGVDDFLGAAAIMSETRFAVAGSIPEGTTFKYSPPNVEWRGFLIGKDLDKLYLESAVIVVPSSWYEGFPNVITRAMMHSRPVITTNLGCFPEIVEGNVNGLLYPPGEIDSLVSCIKQIIYDPAKSSLMGRNGREKAEKQYSREVIYSKLMEIYSKALGMHKVNNGL